jgi:hypothetical protein
MQVMHESQYQDFISFGVLGGGEMADAVVMGRSGHPTKFLNVVMAKVAQPFQAVPD